MGRKKNNNHQKSTPKQTKSNEEISNQKEEQYENHDTRLNTFYSVLDEMKLTLIDRPTEEEVHLLLLFPEENMRQIICLANRKAHSRTISFKIIKQSIFDFHLGTIQFSSVVAVSSSELFSMAIKSALSAFLYIQFSYYCSTPVLILGISNFFRSDQNTTFISFIQNISDPGEQFNFNQFLQINEFIEEIISPIEFDSIQGSIVIHEPGLEYYQRLNTFEQRNVHLFSEHNNTLIDQYISESITKIRENILKISNLAKYLFVKKNIVSMEIYQIIDALPTNNVTPSRLVLDIPSIVPMSFDLLSSWTSAIKSVDALCPSIYIESGRIVEEEFVIDATLTPENGPWKNIPFDIELSFPNQYPFLYPSLRVTNICFHPSVDYEAGTMYVRGIQGEDYYGMMKEVEAEKGNGVERILRCILEVLENPEEESVLCMDAWELYSKNPRRCEQLVQHIHLCHDLMEFEESMSEFYSSTLKATPMKYIRDIFLPYHLEETKHLHLPHINFPPSEKMSSVNVDVESVQGPYRGHKFHFTLSFHIDYPDTCGYVYLREPTMNLFHPQMLSQTSLILSLNLPEKNKNNRKDKNWLAEICKALVKALNINSFQEASPKQNVHIPLLEKYHSSLYTALVEHSLSGHANHLHPAAFMEAMDEIIEDLKRKIDIQAKKDKVDQRSIVVTYEVESGSFSVIPTKDSEKKRCLR